MSETQAVLLSQTGKLTREQLALLREYIASAGIADESREIALHLLSLEISNARRSLAR
jgi:hypothetical protein